MGMVSQARALSVGDTASSLSAPPWKRRPGGCSNAKLHRAPLPHSQNLKGPLDSSQGERELASFKTQLTGFLLLNVFHKWDLLAFRRFLWKKVNMPHLFWAEVKLLRFKMALKWFYETRATGNLSLALSYIEFKLDWFEDKLLNCFSKHITAFSILLH